MLSVGQQFLGEIDGGLGDEEVTECIQKFMPFSFLTVNEVAKEFLLAEQRSVYTTPKSYLELLDLYKKMLTEKRVFTEEQIVRLDTGLQKLLETADGVAVMEEELKVKSVEVVRICTCRIAYKAVNNKEYQGVCICIESSNQ